MPPAVAIGGALAVGVGGSVLASKSQGDAIEDAAATQAAASQSAQDTQLQMFNLARSDFAPFQRLGVESLPLLNYYATGRPTGYDYDAYNQAMSQYNEATTRSPGMVGTISDIVGGQDGGQPVKPRIEDFRYQMPTEGLPEAFPQEKYIPQLEELQPETSETQYIDKLAALDPNIQVDLEGDPIYQAQKQELLRTLGNRFSAGGQLRSSGAEDAIARNMLPYMEASYGRGVDLYGRQSNQFQNLYNLQSGFNQRDYGNRYNALANLFQLSSDLGNQRYSRALDLTKIGTGAATSAGQAALSTGRNVSDIQLGAGQTAAGYDLAIGQNQANLISGLSAFPLQAYSAFSMMNPTGGGGIASGSPYSLNYQSPYFGNIGSA